MKAKLIRMFSTEYDDSYGDFTRHFATLTDEEWQEVTEEELDALEKWVIQENVVNRSKSYNSYTHYAIVTDLTSDIVTNLQDALIMAKALQKKKEKQEAQAKKIREEAEAKKQIKQEEKEKKLLKELQEKYSK